MPKFLIVMWYTELAPPGAIRIAPPPIYYSLILIAPLQLCYEIEVGL